MWEHVGVEKPMTKAQFERAQKLAQPNYRRRYQRTLVEGPQAVRELLTWQSTLVRDVYVEETFLERHADIAALLKSSAVYWHRITEVQLQKISRSAQGIAAVIDIPPRASLEELCGQARLIVMTLAVQDPGNIGTIIRTADFFGADAVILGKGAADPWNPKTIRSTAGSIFHVPVLADADIAEASAACKQAGMQVLAADGHGDWDLTTLLDNAHESRFLGTARPQLDLAAPVAWIFGNEAHGLAGTTPCWDTTVSIPVYGKAESLNVAVSAAVVLSATARLQQADPQPSR